MFFEILPLLYINRMFEIQNVTDSDDVTVVIGILFGFLSCMFLSSALEKLS